jgi:hypothetical protein
MNLLAEHDDDLVGERLAVLDFHVVHRRVTRPTHKEHHMIPALKSAAYTALWTFIGMFGLSVAGFLAQVAEWASSSGRTPFPGVGTLGFALISALAAGAGGIVAFLVRYAQSRLVLPGAPPIYPSTPPA